MALDGKGRRTPGRDQSGCAKAAVALGPGRSGVVFRCGPTFAGWGVEKERWPISA